MMMIILVSTGEAGGMLFPDRIIHGARRTYQYWTGGVNLQMRRRFSQRKVSNFSFNCTLALFWKSGVFCHPESLQETCQFLSCIERAEVECSTRGFTNRGWNWLFPLACWPGHTAARWSSPAHPDVLQRLTLALCFPSSCIFYCMDQPELL